MKTLIVKDAVEMGEVVASLILNQIRQKPNSVLCLPTGSTPIPVYQTLIGKVERHGVSTDHLEIFHLDEYVGLPAYHSQRYATFLSENILDPLNILPEHRHLLISDAKDLAQECQRYDALIDHYGGFDLLMDGLGENGHIAFNEPAESFEARTHVSEVALSTRMANARFFDQLDDVPKLALTLGFADIIQAKTMIVIAAGQKKAPAVERFVTDTLITPAFPMSFLRMHPHLILVVDEAACGSVLNRLRNGELT